MEDYLMNGPDLKASPTFGGFSELGLAVPTGLENTSNPSKQQPSSMMFRETKTTESGAEKKRPLVRDAMLMGNSNMNSSHDGKRTPSTGMSNGLDKLPSHLQVGSSTEQWNAQCPSFMSNHSWKGISTELRKDLKVGEW
eukprot:CAMPEP_0185254336 /NCGR_PEP_ID=MMETSP1359-20130426/3098_1 /TAXON_ID=552665 /ORGANISM="Bigelowiella longifila, Strain CCMP242" /LENGTH=138 /DNA_ID=CAMNT_0027837259 /DNA_START=213 /DNA_END=626 /DNA_ORIENTATION=-